MTILLSHKKKLIIEYTPKSNCTVICKMFFKYLDLLETALDYHKWIHKYENEVYRKQVHQQPNQPHSQYVRLKFIRNPYDRAVSSYIHIMKNHYYNKWNLPNNMSFLTFLKKYKTVEHILYCRPEADHVRPQTDRYHRGERFFNEIICVENLEEEIDRINNKYNINLDCNFNSDHWASKNQNKSNKEFCGNLEWSKIEQLINEKALPEYDCFYNQETKKLVESIYGSDIKLYNKYKK